MKVAELKAILEEFDPEETVHVKKVPWDHTVDCVFKWAYILRVGKRTIKLEETKS
jgi:hypothetical protein